MSQRNVDDDEEYERVWRKQQRLLRKIALLEQSHQLEQAVIEAAVAERQALLVAMHEAKALRTCRGIGAILEAVDAYLKARGE